ncbi:MAG: hypothetical protein ABIN45_06245 [Gammaproteobacteria bacterium]
MKYSKYISPLSLLLVSLVNAGCASTVGKFYPGAEQPSGKIAVIRNNAMIRDIMDRGVVISSVDGAKVSSTTYAVEALPGRHTLGVQCSFRVDPTMLGSPFEPTTTNVRKSQLRQYPASLDVNVEAGHVYQPQVFLRPDQTCKVWLVDISGR